MSSRKQVISQIQMFISMLDQYVVNTLDNILARLVLVWVQF